MLLNENPPSLGGGGCSISDVFVKHILCVWSDCIVILEQCVGTALKFNFAFGPEISLTGPVCTFIELHKAFLEIS
jgi:hypothetical protein